MAQQPPNGEQHGGERRRGMKFYAAVAVAVLALIFILQNTEDAQIDFLFAETELPLFFALLISTLLGVAIGWLIPRVRRGGKAERDE